MFHVAMRILQIIFFWTTCFFSALAGTDQFCDDLKHAGGIQSQLDPIKDKKVDSGDPLADDLGGDRWRAKFTFTSFDVCFITKSVELSLSCEKTATSLTEARAVLKDLERKIRTCLPDAKSVKGDDTFTVLSTPLSTFDLSLSGRRLADANMIPLVRLSFERGTLSREIDDLYIRFSDASHKTATLSPNEKLSTKQLGAEMLARAEQLYGPDAPELIRYLSTVSSFIESYGDYSEASDIMLRSIRISKQTGKTSDIELGTTIASLVRALDKAGRTSEALEYSQRLYNARLESLGPTNSETSSVLISIADFLDRLGRSNEAAAAYERAMEALGESNDPALVRKIAVTAATQQMQSGSDNVAEALLKKGIHLEEILLQNDRSEDRAEAFELREEPQARIALANFYISHGRYDGAEVALSDALHFMEALVGEGSSATIPIRTNLGNLLADTGRSDDAIVQYRRASETTEDLAQKLQFLIFEGTALAKANRLEQAYEVLNAVLTKEAQLTDEEEIDNTELGALSELISVDLQLKKYGEARDQARRHLALFSRLAGKESYREVFRLDRGTSEAKTRLELGQALFATSEKAAGCKEAQTASKIVQAANLDDLSRQQSVIRPSRIEDEWFSETLLELLSDCTHDAPEAIDVAFEYAQTLAFSPAAQSMSQLALRAAYGNGEIATTLRRQQDLTLRRAAIANQLGYLRAEDATELTKLLEKHLSDLNTELRSIDKGLEDKFPTYDQSLRLKIVPLKETMAEVKQHEALILFLSMPKATFVWTVTQTEGRLQRSDLTSAALKTEVQALRCGLDYYSAWDVGGSRCEELTGVSYSSAEYANDKPLPFDTSRSYALFKSLFADSASVLKDKELLIVPSGALTQIPFHVLVTRQPPRSGEPGAIAYLARSNPVTVLPSVSSLKILRSNVQAGGATKPYLGVANPLLNGGKGEEKRKAAALANVTCDHVTKMVTIASRGTRRDFTPAARSGGFADVSELRKASPLPETAEEVCDVAKAVGASMTDVMLGAKATESDIKRMSASGELASYGTIHFSTHGAVAGEVRGVTEPGLLLTPPESATADDDGYLTAPEVMDLRLNANWVILSACNTAAGGSDNAEALSGLARAFLYAGARALLVSHWYVDSKATVQLVTGAFSKLASNPKMGRAAAMQASIVDLIDQGLPPAFWAPFVVVGDGSGR